MVRTSRSSRDYRQLWQLTLNARVSDMDVGTDEREGIVTFAAYGAALTLRADVLDRHGRRATSERVVVSHL